MNRPSQDLNEIWASLIEMAKTNPTDLLRVPRIRSALSSYRFSRGEASLKPLNTAAKAVGRTNTAEYNLKGLKVDSGLDRGSLLFYPLACQNELQNFSSVSRVLCLGPRNEAELLCAIGLGVQESNLRGLDLLSYSDLVDQGDIHKMPFPDNAFDIIIAGWVLAYSDNIEKAISEIYRVARPGGIVSVGWDHSIPSQIKENERNFLTERGELDPNEGIAIQQTKDIIELFEKQGTVLEVFYEQSSSYPYGVNERRNIVCMRITDNEMDLETANMAYREAIGYRLAKHMLGQGGEPGTNNTFSLNLLDQMESDTYEHPKTKASSSYLGMRGLFFYDKPLYAKLITIIRKINHQTMPAHCSDPYESLDERCLLPSTPFAQEIQEIKDCSDEIHRKSYNLIQARLTNDWTNGAKSHLERCQFIDEDGSKIKLKDIVKPGRYFADQRSLQASPDIINLAFSRELISLAENYLECSPIVDFIAATFSIGKILTAKELDSSAQLYHRDKDRLSFLKVFVYLTDVNEASGPHQVVESTHQAVDNKFNYDGRYLTEEVERAYGPRVKTILGKAGSIFAVDTHAIHRGKPLEPNNNRLMLQIQYCSSLIGAESPGLIKELVKRNLNNYHYKYKANPRLFSSCY